MGNLVKPLFYNPAAPDWNAWQENHAKAHSILDLNTQSVLNAAIPKAFGIYEPAFNSGYIQFTGPGQSFLGNTNFIVGTNLPNPSGIRAPALLIGSGVSQAWIITDTWADPTKTGTNLGITAGETAESGTANGGILQLYGGGSFGGVGGAATFQGGTSFQGQGGPTIIAGGNGTNGIPGDLFLQGGVGDHAIQGASVHIIMTLINGLSGFFRIRVNSTVLYEFQQSGAIFIGATGAGLIGQPLVSGGPSGSTQWFGNGFTGTMVTAPLSVGGAPGSITFASGLCTGIIQAT